MTEKSRRQRLLDQVDRVKITPAQARNAGVTGQVGTAAGSITGTLVGSAIGAAVKKPSAGAFMGAGVGAAAGGGTGAAAGLYAARPNKNRPKMPTGPKSEQDPVTIRPKKKAPGPGKVNKAFDETKHKRGQGGKFASSNGGMTEAPGSKKPFMSADTEKKVATGLLGLSGVANVAALKASYKETKGAGKLGSLEGLSRGARARKIASHAGAKVALPLATADLAAGVLAAKVMNKPKEKNVSKSVSVDELFEKARDRRGRAAAEGAAAGATGATAGAVGASTLVGGAYAGGKAKNYASAAKSSVKAVPGVFRSNNPVSRGIAGGAAVGGAIGAIAGKKKKEQFGKSYDEVSKLEKETKRGMKTGAKWGAGVNAALGGAAGMATHGSGKTKAITAATGAAAGAVGGALQGGAVGTAIGAAKASGRKDYQAKMNRKAKKNSFGKSYSDIDALFAEARGEVSP